MARHTQARHGRTAGSAKAATQRQGLISPTAASKLNCGTPHRASKPSPAFLAQLETIAKHAQPAGTGAAPCASLRDFLVRYGKVKMPGGTYGPFTFTGRPAVALLVEWIDEALGSHTGHPLTDTEILAAGGAQWGKTTLWEFAFAYMLGACFKNVGYYLPDDDLVNGVVDSKFRPDVVDQVPWFADLLRVGKAINESGRQVNRKGAIMATDGKRIGQGYFRGCGKIPTTFSMDCTMVDERDDVPEEAARFITGRMSASPLRLGLTAGTQRYHGAGMNKEFESGSQHLGFLDCPECCAAIVPEDHWPQVCRLAMEGHPRIDDPHLTQEGDFKRPGGPTLAGFDHEALYYLACPTCGTELDRAGGINYRAQRPEQIKQRRYSVRVSQLAVDAIPLRLIVFDWATKATRDPEAMAAFCCDRLAKPKSTMQALTPAILERARLAAPYSMTLAPAQARRWAGLDTGDRLYFAAHENASGTHTDTRRLCWAETISPANARARVPQLFSALGLECLFVDIGNEREMARDLVLDINGIRDQPTAYPPDAARGTIRFSPLLWWDGERELWHGLRAAVVEFSLKPGGGVKQVLRRTIEGLCYPVIQCNRDESIQHVVDKLLTADDGLTEVVDGKLRTWPSFLLPTRGANPPEILNQVEAHFLSGSRREKNTDGKTSSFVDQCPNHLLLASTYAELAYRCTAGQRPLDASISTVQNRPDHRAGYSRRPAGVML